MLSKNDIAKLYDTVLSIPGMGDPIKIDLRMPRKNIWLLSKIIQRGLAEKESGDLRTGVLQLVTPAVLEELEIFAMELLQKAGLQELNEKLDAFGEKEGKGGE